MLKVFISYSHQDEVFARELVHSLIERKFEVWIDLKKISPGDTWADRIDEGLRECDVLLLIVTPEAMQSEEVLAEWLFFLIAGKHVIPVIWHRPPKPLHYKLAPLQHIDFQQNDYSTAFDVLHNKLMEIDNSPKPEKPASQPMETGLLFGYLFIENNRREEKILVRDDARFPIIKKINLAEGAVEAAINSAVMEFVSDMGLDPARLLQAGFARPVYYRPYRIDTNARTIQIQPLVFFKLGLQEEVNSDNLEWSQNQYRWEAKSEIVRLWQQQEFKFGTVPHERALISEKLDPYKAITGDWVSEELGRRVLECVDMFVFHKNAAGEVEFLTIQRRAEDPGEYPNWEYPKGGLFYHETPLEGALREINEETGLPSDLLQFRAYLGWQTVDVAHRKKAYDTLRVHGLSFFYSGEPDAVILDGKHTHHQWCTFDDMKKQINWLPYGVKFADRWKHREAEIVEHIATRPADPV